MTLDFGSAWARMISKAPSIQEKYANYDVSVLFKKHTSISFLFIELRLFSFPTSVRYSFRTSYPDYNNA